MLTFPFLSIKSSREQLSRAETGSTTSALSFTSKHELVAVDEWQIWSRLLYLLATWKPLHFACLLESLKEWHKPKISFALRSMPSAFQSELRPLRHVSFLHNRD